MSPYVIVREAGHPFVTGTAPAGLFALRATVCFVERDCIRLAARFIRTGIFLNESLRSVRSTLSRYCDERAGVRGLVTGTAILLLRLAVCFDPAKALPHEHRGNGARN